MGGGAYGGSFIPIPAGSGGRLYGTGGAGGRTYGGSGGYPTYGSGGYPTYGSGGYPAYGSGGRPGGSGGWIAGSGGMPACSSLPACSTWANETWTIQLVRDASTWRTSISGRPDGSATIVYQEVMFDSNGQPMLDEWGWPLWNTTSCRGIIDSVTLANLRCVVESKPFQSSIQYGFTCAPSTAWTSERIRFIDGATTLTQDTSSCLGNCLLGEVMVNVVRTLDSIGCVSDDVDAGTGGRGGSSTGDGGVSDAPTD